MLRWFALLCCLPAYASALEHIKCWNMAKELGRQFKVGGLQVQPVQPTSADSVLEPYIA
jgi:hypothetical protein